MTLSPTGVTEAAWGEDGKEAEDGEDHTNQEEDDPYQVRARRARWTPHTVGRGPVSSDTFTPAVTPRAARHSPKVSDVNSETHRRRDPPKRAGGTHPWGGFDESVRWTSWVRVWGVRDTRDCQEGPAGCGVLVLRCGAVRCSPVQSSGRGAGVGAHGSGHGEYSSTGGGGL